MARFRRKAKTNSHAMPAARDTPGFTPCARGPRVLQQALRVSLVSIEASIEQICCSTHTKGMAMSSYGFSQRCSFKSTQLQPCKLVLHRLLSRRRLSPATGQCRQYLCQALGRTYSAPPAPRTPPPTCASCNAQYQDLRAVKADTELSGKHHNVRRHRGTRLNAIVQDLNCALHKRT